MTTQTLLTEWLETYEKELIKSRTYSRYQGLISAHINPILGEQHIETLSRRDIQEFLLQQKAEGNVRTGGGKLSATSANLMLTVLNLAFEYACDMETTFVEFTADCDKNGVVESAIDMVCLRKFLMETF